MVNTYRFYMQLSREEYLKYYAGEASCIQVYSEDGTSLQFPASAAKPWITHRGIEGFFIIKFDANHKLISLKKIKSN